VHRLERQPGPALREALVEHVTEDLLLYDYDELTQVSVCCCRSVWCTQQWLQPRATTHSTPHPQLHQVAFGAYALPLALPDHLLADITRRAEALEGAGQAADTDRPILHGALQRLAAQRATTNAAVNDV
jgi:hypothetical protein